MLCAITGNNKDGNGAASGCGVFISPKRVLTAWHVVEGLKDVQYTNIIGITSTMLPKNEGGQHYISRKHDLALIELRKPITATWASVNKRGAAAITGSPFQEYEGWMGTMYGGKPAVHDVRVSRPLSIEEEKIETEHGPRREFKASVKAVPGYSGSPIFAADGMTVISILTNGNPAKQRQDEDFNQMFSSISSGHTKAPSSGFISFMGPRLTDFSSWAESVEQRLGFI